jgi:hypothetical protein
MPGRSGCLDEALRGQIVNFVWLAFGQRKLQGCLVEHIAGDEVYLVLDVLNPAEAHRAGTPDQTVHFVSLAQQELGQIGTVLTCDSGDQCAFCHDFSPER